MRGTAVKQLVVFLENRPGHLAHVTQALAAFALLPPEQSSDPRQQLRHVNRLDHVVVRAHFQAVDLIALLAQSRHHDERHFLGIGILAEGPADLKPAGVRQYEVEDHQVRLLVAREADCLLASGCGQNLVARLLHAGGEHFQRTGFVLDD